MSRNDQLVLKSDRNTSLPLQLSTKVINTSGGVARYTLSKTKTATDIYFNTFKSVHEYGFTFLVGKTGIITLPVDLIGALTMKMISMSHDVTRMSLEGTSEAVRMVQQFFGDTFMIELANCIFQILTSELVTTQKSIGIRDLYILQCMDKSSKHHERIVFAQFCVSIYQ